MDVSNKTLAVLLVATIAVSLGALFVSINKFESLEKYSVSGFATSNATGTATLTIGSTARLIFQDDTVDWTSGSVNTTGGNLFCNLTTEGSNDDTTYCIGFTTDSDGLILRNDGNTIFTSVRLNSSQTSDTMLGGTDPLLMIRASEENNACLGELNWTSMYEIDSDFTVDVASAPQLCEDPGFNFTEDDDDIYLDINVTIPYNSNTGARTVAFRAMGTY
ncbi:hypothetical protein JXC34_03925 [Candidatus Woesearchaeota archaeon]|nr:hypothetical protein [Candidatus Woesearchaeota archaeon]